MHLVACSVKRLPHIWTIVTQPVTVLSVGLEKSLANVAVIKTSAKPAVLKNELIAFLKSEFGEPTVTEIGRAHV